MHQRMARSPFCSQGSADSMSGADSNDDSDSDEPLSDAEFDSDSSYTLQVSNLLEKIAFLYINEEIKEGVLFFPCESVKLSSLEF